MRTNLFFPVSVIMLTCSLCVNAQDVALKDLKTPNSPGFQLLDISPSSIERPTNPKAFALSLFNLTSNGSVIPKNFAFEVSPYWYTKPDNATVYKYLNIANGKARNMFTGIYNKMSVSLASSFNDSTAGSLLKNTNYISAGIRTNLLTIRSKAQNDRMAKSILIISGRMGDLKTRKDEKNKLKGARVIAGADLRNEEAKLSGHQQILRAEQAKTEANRNVAVIAAAESDILSSTSQINTLQNKIAAIDVEIIKIADARVEELEKALEKDKDFQDNMQILDEVPVFQLDAAFAYAEAIADNVYANKRFARSAFWFTGAFAWKQLSFSLSMRFMNDNVLVDTVKNIFVKNNPIDFGGKLEYKIKNISFSMEYIKRQYPGISVLDNERTVGQIQYKISEGVFVTGTFGKNFGTAKNVFTLLGINWGLGKTSLPL